MLNVCIMNCSDLGSEVTRSIRLLKSLKMLMLRHLELRSSQQHLLLFYNKLFIINYFIGDFLVYYVNLAPCSCNSY